MPNLLSVRRSGVLLHPTSLPSRYGIGDFGPAAFRFVDQLAAAGQTLWQVLPLVEPDMVGSPYASASALAGNWLLISPEHLVKQGFLDPVAPWTLDNTPVSYADVHRRKFRLFQKAYQRFRTAGRRSSLASFRQFKHRSRDWLGDYSLFMAMKDEYGQSLPWTRWPNAIRTRRAATMRRLRQQHASTIEFYEFLQWLFDLQWSALRRYAHRWGISIIGDMPIYVTRDSVDTWAEPKNFLLDRLGRPRLVSGVPPDYFSSRGQVWGDPLYDWKHIQRENFAWWIRRFRRSFQLYDLVRLDHFRGYRAAWGIRAGSRSARHGSWHAVPGEKLFQRVQRVLPHGRFIAEDLGMITSDVVELRNSLGFPGVRVLQFGFDDLGSIHVLEHLSRRSVTYTGTHDNNTTRGWLAHEANRRERGNVKRMLGVTAQTVAPKFVAAVMASRANTIILPMQDILNLGGEARMNTPGKREGNWRWRFRLEEFSRVHQDRLRRLAKRSHRRIR